MALEAFESAVAAFQSWRSGAQGQLSLALQDAPAFVMAHVLQAYLHLSSRDPAQVAAARPALAKATGLPANPRERLHLAAIAAVLADDYERAKVLLGELLRQHPRDVLALQVAHALDYLTGDLVRMGDRLPGVLPAWSRDLPGYPSVLAMHAFGLEECGRYGLARGFAQQALELNPFDARAHHVLAHVFEMAGPADAGLRWMYQNADYWGVGTIVATHCWWHVALLHLAEGEVEKALSLYDGRVRAGHSPAISDMIDAASLLWRIELDGGEAGPRWSELSAAWAPHIADGFCTFTDMHAMMAFVGARDWTSARQLESALMRRYSQRTRYGKTTRQVGLNACRALIAFGRGDYARAIALLDALPPLAHRIGGSHAQRGVLHVMRSRTLELLSAWSRRLPGTRRAQPASDARPHSSARAEA